MTTDLKDKIIRRKKTFNQEEIAKKLKVSQSFVSQMLNGKRPVPKKLQSKLQKLILI